MGSAPSRGVTSKPLSRLRNEIAVGVEFDGDALVLEDLLDGGRDVLVLAGCQPRALLDDGDLGAEAPVHLGELERDVAAADDDEMFRQRVEVEDADVGQVVDVGQTRHVGHDGTAADVEEDLVRLAEPGRRPRWCADR